MSDKALCFELSSELKTQSSLRVGQILYWLNLSAGKYYRVINPPPKQSSATISVALKRVPIEIEKKVVEVAIEHYRLGYRKIHHILRTRHNLKINKDTVYRILKDHALLKKKQRKAADIKKKYKAKLKELLPSQRNQVWQMDVTYVFVENHGFYFQIDIQDYFSKYILAQRFTHSYSAKEGIAALREAVDEAERLCGSLDQPIHLITDNGTTFVAKLFTKKLKDYSLHASDRELFDHIRIGYRMPQHIGSIERFHGCFKQECVYLHWFEDPLEAERVCRQYGAYYNFERPHWGLKLKTPAEVYLDMNYQETLKFKPSKENIQDKIQGISTQCA